MTSAARKSRSRGFPRETPSSDGMASAEKERRPSQENKVLKYEQFLNERLKNDLGKVLAERDKLYENLSEYYKLKNVIEGIKESGLETKEIKTKVDLGCNFYVQARVPDARKIFVYVGFGFYVEFTHLEALQFIDKKTRSITDNINRLTQDASKIKAHIKLVLEGLRELQSIDDKVEKPHRDIFS